MLENADVSKQGVQLQIELEMPGALSFRESVEVVGNDMWVKIDGQLVVHFRQCSPFVLASFILGNDSFTQRRLVFLHLQR